MQRSIRFVNCEINKPISLLLILLNQRVRFETPDSLKGGVEAAELTSGDNCTSFFDFFFVQFLMLEFYSFLRVFFFFTKLISAASFFYI